MRAALPADGPARNLSTHARQRRTLSPNPLLRRGPSEAPQARRRLAPAFAFIPRPPNLQRAPLPEPPRLPESSAGPRPFAPSRPLTRPACPAPPRTPSGEVQPVTVAGESFTGPLALTLGARHPKAADNLIVVNRRAAPPLAPLPLPSPPRSAAHLTPPGPRRRPIPSQRERLPPPAPAVLRLEPPPAPPRPPHACLLLRPRPLPLGAP